ncbi:hypothetical protein D1BOALGB6SA_14 [Olavius sp. associated proteobacterium Delta 1]|nr:hypothetical protein D1BOALGB6SA_14 [Olavius sp. associated proteobacterium Delta 1]
MGNRVKLLLTTSIFPNSYEPTKGIYIYRQAKALLEFCDVKVIAPVPYVPGWMKLPTYEGYLRVPRKENLNGLEVLYPRYVVTPRIGRAFYGLSYFVSVWNCARKNAADSKVILTYWAYPDGFGSVLLGKKRGLPVLLGGLGCDINDAENDRIRRRMVSFALRKSEHVMSVSAAMKRKMCYLGVPEDKVIVIPNGVEEKFKPIKQSEARNQIDLGIVDSTDSKEKWILYIGRFSSEKGLETLLKATKVLAERGSKVRVILVGNGPEKKKLENMSIAIGLSKILRFVDEVSHEKVPIIMNCADVFCLPSIREGWPNVVMEALACGIPVVASNVGGLPEIIAHHDYGLLVPAGDPVGLADGLESAINRIWDKDVVRSAVRNRTWKHVAEEIWNLVQMAI